MGYTIVTAFDPKSYRIIEDIMQGMDACKIPFGRRCDRIAADQLLKYHITLFHWGKEYDEFYLPKLERMPFRPFDVSITSVRQTSAEEGSSLLYFDIKADRTYRELRQTVFDETGIGMNDGWLHMTLAVDQDWEKIDSIKRTVESRIRFPFPLHVEGLDVYQIWKPVKWVRRIRNRDF